MLRGVATAVFAAVLMFGFQPAGADQLLVVSKAEKKLAFYDAGTGQLLGSATTGDDPREVVVTPDKRRAFVSDFGSRKTTVSVFDVKGHSLVTRFEFPSVYGPHGMVVTGDGKSLFVTFEKSRAIGRIDPSSGKLIQTIKINMKGSHYLALSSDDQWLYVANGVDNNVTRINVSTGEVERHIFAGIHPEPMAISPGNAELWVGAQGLNVINIIDLAGTRKVETDVPCPASPTRMKFTPDGERVLVTFPTANKVLIFDPDSREVVATLETGRNPHDVVITPDSRLAYVGLAADSRIAVFDLETLELVREFATMETPAGIAYVD